MHRKFIALILGTALTITSAGIAAPARADTNDVAKVLAGLAAIAILGKAIDDARDRPDVYVNRGHSHYNNGNPGYIRRHTDNRGYNGNPRPLPNSVKSRDLPRGCLINVDVPGRRDQQLYGARCLENNYAHARSLPRACRADLRNGNRTRATYKPGCLHQHGYRLARR